jgi:segregation and condensation protein B
MDLKTIVEAMIFAAPDPILASEIAKAIRRGAEEAGPAESETLGNTTEAEVAQIILELESEFESRQSPTILQQSPVGWRIVTRPELAHWIRALLPEMRPERLSQPALETLALVAYRQPITKADMEAIRGVNCDGMVTKLLERNLIETAGRADLPGRPMLYKTTTQFLEHFGVHDLDSLPNVRELRNVKLPTAKIEEPAAGKEPETKN